MKGIRSLSVVSFHPCVPAIVSWPQKIKKEQVTDVLVSQIDWFRSLSTLINATLPQGAAPDSYDHLANWLGQDKTDRPWVIEQALDHTLSVRTKDWKYIEPSNGEPNTGEFTNIETGYRKAPSLYDMNTWTLEMGENNNNRTNKSWFDGKFTLFGLFGRVDYDFASKYLVTAIVRRDGVSRFSKANRYGVFPSLSLGWRLSQEGFMENTKSWLDDLKVRAGFGITGNSDVPRATNYAYEFTTDPTLTNYDLTGSQGSAVLGYRLGKIGNPDTKWEKTQMTNVGVDATFLNGKFSTNLEWYYKKTSDMDGSVSTCVPITRDSIVAKIKRAPQNTLILIEEDYEIPQSFTNTYKVVSEFDKTAPDIDVEWTTVKDYIHKYGTKGEHYVDHTAKAKSRDNGTYSRWTADPLDIIVQDYTNHGVRTLLK